MVTTASTVITCKWAKGPGFQGFPPCLCQTSLVVLETGGRRSHDGFAVDMLTRPSLEASFLMRTAAICSLVSLSAVLKSATHILHMARLHGNLRDASTASNLDALHYWEGLETQ